VTLRAVADKGEGVVFEVVLARESEGASMELRVT
jgi:hypothetical protein